MRMREFEKVMAPVGNEASISKVGSFVECKTKVLGDEPVANTVAKLCEARLPVDRAS
jgi:hypothetical protein